MNVKIRNVLQWAVERGVAGSLIQQKLSPRHATAIVAAIMSNIDHVFDSRSEDDEDDKDRTDTRAIGFMPANHDGDGDEDGD